jgi:Type II secretion system (T2SS), protein M subtype b
MPDLKRTRIRLTIAIAGLILIDAVCVVMLLTPFAGRESLRQDEMRDLWVNLKSRESAPWRGLDKKIPRARQDLATFYRDRFPSGYSAISTDLDRIASHSGVKISSEKYTQKDSDLQNLQLVEVETEVSGDYLQLVKFINTVERNQLFFIIDNMELAGEQSGPVKLRMKLQTYLRTT